MMNMKKLKVSKGQGTMICDRDRERQMALLSQHVASLHGLSFFFLLLSFLVVPLLLGILLSSVADSVLHL